MQKDQKIIIALSCVIIAILIVGILMLSPLMAKEDCKLTVEDKTIYSGDSLVIQLKDNNEKPISNETVHIKLKDKKNNVIEKDVKTNSKGKAKLKVKNKGEYSIECTFDGNDKFKACSLESNLDVKNGKTKVLNEEQTSTVTHTTKYAPNGGIYPEYGPEVDTQGITREYAIANDMHYIEMTVDGDRPGEYVTVGGYVAYDPAAGCYHT